MMLDKEDVVCMSRGLIGGGTFIIIIYYLTTLFVELI